MNRSNQPNINKVVKEQTSICDKNQYFANSDRKACNKGPGHPRTTKDAMDERMNKQTNEQTDVISVQSLNAEWTVTTNYDSFNYSELLPLLVKTSYPYEGTKTTHFGHKHDTPVACSPTLPRNSEYQYTHGVSVHNDYTGILTGVNKVHNSSNP